MLEERIVHLKRDIVSFASLVEKMIESSVDGLVKKNRSILKEVVDVMEPRANNCEIDIDEQCITLIARFQPKARELRTILMIMQINKDIERMGDHAVNIAESALFLIERPQVKPLIDTPRMAQISINMLKDSITSFVDENPALAQSVFERDNDVDNLGEQILRELITFMTSDPTTIERSLHILRIARELERIADLSTNMCEDTIFIVQGRVIKHHKENDPS
ncbi:MAG: phosphate signaling complex protein PhoU [Deltaproteobacteria bacterium]|jgi:phosphate transport system protein|nr:phosphate signaling complex protein PhoU [Candidatus Zymogenaceae bacterium]